MPTIYPAALPASASNGLSRSAQTKDAAAPLPVSVGEIREAGVKAGAVASNALYNGYLKIFRGNPEALLEIFQKGQEIFNQPSINEFLPKTAKDTLGKISKIIDSLLCSPKSSANPLYLKDYAAKIGLSLEGLWLDCLRQGRDNQRRPADSLKGLLLKLADELRGLLKEKESLAPAELQKLTHLAKFTEGSVRAIEVQQMININAQETDGNYLLQIPLLFPEGVRTGELFIDLGKNGPRGDGIHKKVHVVMFLNMDQLGDMAVDASLNDNNIACVFKFTDPEAQEFFAPLLAGLGDALRRLGYASAALSSLVTEDLMVARQESHREMFYEQDAINLFA